jgi:hypothetical protein
MRHYLTRKLPIAWLTKAIPTRNQPAERFNFRRNRRTERRSTLDVHN